MTRPPRDNFAEQVGPAMRACIEQAFREDLVRGRGRVLLAVMYLTASYSRVGDRLYVAQIAGVAQLEESYVRRILREYDDRGVLEYHGGLGQGARSWVSLRPTEHRLQPLMKPVSMPTETGLRGTGKGTGEIAKGDSGVPLPRRSTEKVPDVADDALPIELERVLEPFAPSPAQRARWVAAWRESPAGFAFCVDEAVRKGRRPPAMLDAMISRGVYRTALPLSDQDAAERWVRVTAWQLEREHILEVIEDRWPSIDDNERVQLAQLAMELRDAEHAA